MFQHKCDLINMSYGEPTFLPDYGRFIDLASEVIVFLFVLTTFISVFVALQRKIYIFIGGRQAPPYICE